MNTHISSPPKIHFLPTSTHTHTHTHTHHVPRMALSLLLPSLITFVRVCVYVQHQVTLLAVALKAGHVTLLVVVPKESPEQQLS